MVLQPLNISKFALFFATYLPHYMSVNAAPFHHNMFKELDDPENTRLCLEFGRGSAKTTIGSIGYSIYQICEGSWEEMQVVSRAAGANGTSTKIMRRVKREFEENDLLIYDYGIKRGQKWGDETIEVVRGDGHRVIFYSLGKRSSIRGSRGPVLIDDPQNSDDCRSETVLRRDWDWLAEDVLPVMLPGQPLIFIGTPISPLSLLVSVKSLPEFKVLSSPMENPVGSGHSAWPEQYSDEFLASQKSIMGVDAYAAEYLCQPKVPGNPLIKREWLNHYDPGSEEFKRIRLNSTYIVMGGDAAESKADAADYTHLVTVLQTFGDRPDYYVIDARRGHWSTKEGAEQVMMVFDKEQQHKTIVESRIAQKTNQLGDAFIQEIRDRERIYGKNVNLYPIRPSKDKVQRLRYVQGLFQEGRVYFDFHNTNHQILINELTMFTGDQQFHDDGVDAIGYALADMKDHGTMSSGIKITSALQGSW